MADQSRDPIESARMDRLEAELIALREQIQASTAANQAALSELRSQSAGGGGARGGAAKGESLSGREPEVVRQTTASMDQLTAAEKQAAAAARERLAVQEREAAMVARTARERGGAGAAGAAPVAGVRTTNLESVSDLSARQQILLTQARELAPAERTISAEMEYNARATSLASLAYQRHGALQTEVIAAAAKGQVAIKDLGDQMLLTIGKFAGWTGAAAAVYGVIGAVTSLGKGAVDSASGVGQLSRFIDNVDTSKAQEQFRNLSRENNVTIKDSADAVAAFAKIFQDQDQAVAAADIALKATQLDQISLADSTRFLTGAIVGFHLPASQLPAIFDQINNAQRRFGASVAQTLAAMGGSAAAVRNAGGDFNQYVALVTSAQRATAQTGSVIGTAFRRSATQFITKPNNIAILKGFGLDPTEAYTQLILDAVKKAQSLTGPEINKLATGLGGPQQGARVFAGLLQRPDLVKRALEVTSPAKSAGSAAQEMGDRLSQADQKIKAMVNSLERLGSALAQSGALTPFVALIGGFGQMADLLSHIIALVDKLPGGLGSVLVPLGEITLLFRALASRDLGASIPARFASQRPGGLGEFLRGTPGAPGLLRPSNEAAARKDFEKGLDEQTGYYEELQAGAAQTRNRLGAEVEAQKAYITQIAASGATQEELIAEQQRLLSIQRNGARAVAQEGFYRSAITELDEQKLVYLAGIRAGMTADQAALEAGFRFRPGSLSRPSGGGVPVVIGGAGGEAEARAGATGAGFLAAGGVLPAERNLSRAAQATAEESAAQVEATAAQAGALSAAVAGATAKATAAASTAATGVRALGTSIGGFLTKGISPFMTALIGIPLAFEAISAIEHTVQSDLNAAISGARPGIGPEQLDTAAKNAQARADALGTQLEDSLLKFSQLPERLLDKIGGIPFQGDATPGQIDRQVSQLDAAAAAQIRKQRTRGVGLEEPVVENEIRRRYSEAQTRAGQDQTIQRGWDEVHHGWEAVYITGQAATDAASRYYQFVATIQAEHARSGASIREQLAAIPNVAGVQQFLQANQLRFDIQGPGSRLGIQGAAEAQARLAELLSHGLAQGLDPAQLTKAVSAFKTAQSQIKQNADSAQQQALALAGTDPAAQAGARADYLRTLQVPIDATHASLESVLSRIRDDRAQIKQARERLAGYETVTPGSDTSSEALTQQIAQERAKIGDFERAGALHHQTADQLRDLLKQQLRDMKVAREEVAKANEQAAVALIDANASLAESRTQDPLAKAQLAEQAAQAAIAKLRASGINDPVQKATLLQKAQDALNQEVDSQLTRFTQGLDLQFAQADIGATPQQRLENAVGKAQQLADHIRSLGAKVSPDKLTAALISLASAQSALQDFFNQQRLDTINANFQLLESQTTDPLAVDRLEIWKDQQLAAQARTPNDRKKAQSDVNKARSKFADDKASERQDQVSFELQLGEITNQQAILDLEAILKMRGLSYNVRKSLKRQLDTLLHQGQQDPTGFDLNVGSIKLPTAYDVRRAFDQARGTIRRAEAAVNVTNQNKIDITATSKDAEKAVYDALDRLLTTQIRQAARSAGLRR